MSLSRRDLFRLWATSASSALAACSEPLGGSTRVVETPEGPVLQWEKDELLVLVAGLAPRYRPGDALELRITLNNQAAQTASVRFRTKVVGRGQQTVVEAEPSTVTIRSFDAVTVAKRLALPRSLSAGDYTLRIELPRWLLGGQPVGTGGSLSGRFQIE